MVCWSLCAFFFFFGHDKIAAICLCININLCIACHSSLMTVFALLLHVLLASRCHAAFCHQIAFLSFVLFCSFHKPSINMSVVCISIFAHLISCKHLQVFENQLSILLPKYNNFIFDYVICDIYNILLIESNE